MRKIDCSICENKEIPLNDSINIDGEVYCNSCFEAHFSDKSNLKNKLVIQEFDPTICVSCSKDFGDTILIKISNYPICTDCEMKIEENVFPMWVKGFIIGILVVVFFSFLWNWNFYSAYNEIKKSNEYFQIGDYANAANLMKSASIKVPEVEEITTLSSFFNGIELLAKDKSSEALIEFEKCKNKLPTEYDVKKLIAQAKIGSAFDNKQYNDFLYASKGYLTFDSTSAVVYASIASAYACLFAENGKDEDKQNANIFLSRAKQIDNTSKEMKLYYNIIEYRIFSQKIIKREEFIKQFPTGWTN